MRKRSLFAGIMAAVLSLTATGLAACGDKTEDGPQTPPEEEGEVMPTFDYKTYDNVEFSNYLDGAETDSIKLPGQYAYNGMGDPFVMRFNGTYYLYTSTRSTTTGVRCWKSKDLINWEQCQGEGLEYGFVSEDSCLRHAYAPEVYYFNGKFYMYTSPHDDGHYTLTADSPEGPFTRVTDNYKMVIDGSVFIDDDESMYFLHASHEGLKIHDMNSMVEPETQETLLKNTTLTSEKFNWTEGPMIIKRDGIYYLTYTGTQVKSPAYRILYNTELDGNELNSRDAFAGQAESSIVLNTEGDYSGLGHSSTVLGPDMDSYYIVYHNLHVTTDKGCWRGYNFDRLIFNGTQMSVDSSDKRSVAAQQPEFTADGVSGLEKDAARYLSSKTTGEVFTAEFNFKGDKVKCIAGFEDVNNYIYAMPDYSAHTIKLVSVSDGKESVIASGELKNDFNPDVIHTVRIAYAEGKADVHFDNMTKIRNAEISVGAGKIGYEGGNISYTAFSNVAKGSSDKLELKQSGAKIGSSTYLPENAYENLSSYKLSEKSKLTEYKADKAADKCFDGAYQLELGAKEDFARYSVFFRDAGKYGLALTYDAEYAGRTIGVQTDLGEITKVKLPSETEDGTGVITAVIANVNIEKRGGHLISLHNTDGKVTGFISFTFGPYSDTAVDESLTDYAENGKYPVKTDPSSTGRYEKEFALSADGHTTNTTCRMVAYFGDKGLTDYETQVDMKVSTYNGRSAGIIFRAKNISANPDYDDIESLQGYYLGISQTGLFIDRCDYNYTVKNVVKVTHSLKQGEWITLKAVVKGNLISVYVNDEFMFEYRDARAFTNGHAGICSNYAVASYKNFSIKPI